MPEPGDPNYRYSVNEYPTDGVQTEFEISFAGGYINQDYVNVRLTDSLGGVTVPIFTFVNQFTISITPAPATGGTLMIYRDTPADTPLVDFNDAAIINETALDLNAKQAVHLAAETRDIVGSIPSLEILQTTQDTLNYALSRVNHTGVQPISTVTGLQAELDAKALATDVATALASNSTGDRNRANHTGTQAISTIAGLQASLDSKAVAATLAAALGPNTIGYGSDQSFADGTVGNELVPRVTLAGLATVQAKADKVAFVHDSGKEGHFICRAGSVPYTDTYNGLYKASSTAGFYWERLWDKRNARAEWFGIVPNNGGVGTANNTRIYAALTLVATLGGIVWLSANDYWFDSVVRLDLPYMKLYGMGGYYTDTTAQVTRIISTSGTDQVVELGPSGLPGGGINSFPQGIEFRDAHVTRSVAPVISSNCRGVLMRYVLYCTMANITSNGSMIGFEERGTVHSFKINCAGVRAGAGSGGGTDYFVGHYANGGFSIGAAGGNASLYNVDCTAGCNYGPLQTASGSIGFKADQEFTDVWYWNPETTNFYMAQGVFGNDSGALVFSNTDFAIIHPIHDQFHYVGLYVTDVASAGSVEIEIPYFGPASNARACYWVNSAEGAVRSRGGQYVMGGAPNVQAMILDGVNGCDVVGWPIILEHGNTYPVASVNNAKSGRIELFAKNPTVSAGAIVQIAGTCDAMVYDCKASGKAAAFQYGYQVLGTGDVNSEYRVTGLASSCLQAANRKLHRNGTPVTAIGLAGTNYAVGVFT